MEHAQEIRAQDRPRFSASKIIASMQPYHLIDDGQWAEKVIGGQRIHDLYVFKSLFDNGTTVAFGSDWAVAPATPIEGIYAAVTRSTLDGKNPDGWIVEQKITLEQALKAYTSDAAFAGFDENIKGVLKKGYLADFVLLDRDMTTLKNMHELWNCTVKMTVVDGKVMYKR